MGELYVVIDTNVLVSALITRNKESPPVRILQLLSEGKIIPVFSTGILDEYDEVLRREKFKLPDETVDSVIDDIKTHGIEVKKILKTKETMLDPKDVIFFSVAESYKRGKTLLVTGNIKHFPKKSFVLKPAQLVEIFNKL